jgi:hypothetical protein
MWPSNLEVAYCETKPAPNMADSKIRYNWRFVAEKIIELNNSICEKS